MENYLEQKYFNIWRINIDIKREKDFYDTLHEEEMENDFARENGMEPIYYCWDCKFSVCEREHNGQLDFL